MQYIVYTIIILFDCVKRALFKIKYGTQSKTRYLCMTANGLNNKNYKRQFVYT